MRRVLPLFTAALIAAITALFASPKAEAGTLPISKPAFSTTTEGGLLTRAGYYGSYHAKTYDDNDGYDDDYGYSRKDYDYKRYNYKDYGDDDYDYKDYGHKYYSHSCGYPRYVQKYVCDQTVPRCFRQRETLWFYGREYMRYVRKCVGGENYCKWVSVPVYDDCD